MISTRLVELVIDTVVCLTLAKWETVSGQFGGYLMPSIRWKATRRPSASQTVTLMLMARLCALARAAWMARFASASLIDISIALRAQDFRFVPKTRHLRVNEYTL